ncbi:variant 6, serine palmitoyltransferase component [Lathyrus oleraceus]|uniref:Variant 6, serine palmitoyltransferase component n=1 Tax=Pisum sativum TaxID=3888 RepID=A0A9D5A538_PEA|nr:variant 6, serine palmitoyltransferase component [Pisum sativum]
MLRKVREVNLKTVVVGDYWDRDLGKNADLWLPWNVVENGKVEGMGLMGKTEGLDDELLGDQDLDYDEYVTEEEVYERIHVLVTFVEAYEKQIDLV